MARYRAFAKWLQATRLARGIPSRAELGRRAKLGTSHIAQFERGELRPGWGALRKIMDALELQPAEREEATRIWTAAGLPRPAREIVQRFPGPRIWQHLPALAVAKRDQPPEPFQTINNVGSLPNPLRALAALLAWVELHENGLSAAVTRRLREQVLSLAGSGRGVSIGEDGRSTPICGFPRDHLAEFLPRFWDAELFSSRAATVRMLGLVEHWGTTETTDQEFFYARLSGARSQPLSVGRVRLPVSIQVHYALTRWTLWQRLALAEPLGPFDPAWIARGFPALDLARRFIDDPASLSADRIVITRQELELARRLFDVPAVAQALLGQTLQEYESLLSAFDSAVRAWADARPAPAAPDHPPLDDHSSRA